MFKKWVTSLILFVVVVLVAACQGLAGEPQIVATLPPRPTSVPISAPQQAPDLSLGAQVFAANCTRCHGLTGLGDGEFVQSGQVANIPSFADPASMIDQSPVDYFRIITEGKLDALMPPWGDELSEGERWAVALYVYTLPYSQQTLIQGQAVWEANCVRCHGADGSGAVDNGTPLPTLLDVSETQALTTVANGIPDQMPAFGTELSAVDQAAVVAYARTLGLNSGTAAEIAQPATTPEPDSTAVEIVQPASTPEAESTEVVASGVVFGNIANGTAGAVIPPNLTLTLHIVDAAFNETVFDTIADAQGVYRFEGVPLLTNRDYVITTEYNAVTFVSEIINVEPTLSEVQLPITVYESGADASAILIDGMTTQLTSTNGTMQMVQIISFANVSDRVFINRSESGQTSVSVPVPTGAQYHDFTGSYTLSDDGSQILDSEPLIPGEPHLVHASFILPYTSGMSIQQPMSYRMSGQYEVLIGTDGLTVASDILADQGSIFIGEFLTYSYAALVDLPAGQGVNYTVSGTPVTATTTSVTSTTTPVNPLAYLLIGVGIGSIGVAGVLYLGEQRKKIVKPQAAPSLSTNDLMKQIADLDVQFQSGKLERKTYESQRAVLKAQLTALMKGQKQ